tara:strand:- start:1027 stop:1473 length:447 start_codon:yes stop_codon:yes gene_type:complete
MKGTIYKISNNEKTCIYVGSTTEKNPKKRLYRHKNMSKQECYSSRYGELFKNEEILWDIIWEGEVNEVSELRELENCFINIHKKQGVCVNNNSAYVPDCLKKDNQRKAYKKYKLTDGGKLNRKWQNYRNKMRRKLFKEMGEKSLLIKL